MAYPNSGLARPTHKDFWPKLAVGLPKVIVHIIWMYDSQCKSITISQLLGNFNLSSMCSNIVLGITNRTTLTRRGALCYDVVGVPLSFIPTNSSVPPLFLYPLPGCQSSPNPAASDAWLSRRGPRDLLQIIFNQNFRCIIKKVKRLHIIFDTWVGSLDKFNINQQRPRWIVNTIERVNSLQHNLHAE